jgi:hypothetical protein
MRERAIWRDEGEIRAIPMSRAGRDLSARSLMLLVTSNVCEFKREGAVVHPGYFYLVFKSLIEIGLLTDRNPSPAKSKHQSSAQNGPSLPA